VIRLNGDDGLSREIDGDNPTAPRTATAFRSIERNFPLCPCTSGTVCTYAVHPATIGRIVGNAPSMPRRLGREACQPMISGMRRAVRALRQLQPSACRSWRPLSIAHIHAYRALAVPSFGQGGLVQPSHTVQCQRLKTLVSTSSTMMIFFVFQVIAPSMGAAARHDAVTVWSRSSSLSNGHWMQQPQRICYSVFDQVEPTGSAMAALVPAHAFNARRRGCLGQSPDKSPGREEVATIGCAQ
jgi:hypothetical protein